MEMTAIATIGLVILGLVVVVYRDRRQQQQIIKQLQAETQQLRFILKQIPPGMLDIELELELQQRRANPQVEITDLKQATLALQRSERQLKQVLSSAAASIVRLKIWSEQAWEFDYCSAGSELVYGYSDTEFLADPNLWISRLHPEDLETVILPSLTKVLAGKAHQHEFRFHHRAGDIRWIRATVNPYWDDAENCWLTTIVNVDVTLQKQAEIALQESGVRNQAILAVLPDLIDIINADGIVVDTVSRCSPLDLIDPAIDPIGKSLSELIPEALARRKIKAVQQALATEQIQIYEQQVDFGDRLQYEEVRCVPTIGDRVLSVVRDITHQKQIEHKLRLQAEREKAINRVVQTIRQSLELATVFERAVEEVAYLLQVDRVAIYQYQANPRHWQKVAECRQPDTSPKASPDTLPDYDNPVAHRLKRLHIVRVDQSHPIPLNIPTFLKRYAPAALLMVPLHFDNRIWGTLALARHWNDTDWNPDEIDLTCAIADQLAIAIQQSALYEQLQQANQKLQHLATHDALTKLANRRQFDDFFTQTWHHLVCNDLDQALSLVLCDVDYFKSYNDVYGHLAGDHCLIAVAAALNRAINQAVDLVARYGGEEFVAVLPNTDRTGAMQVVVGMQQEISTLNCAHRGSPIANYLTLSFGIAVTYPNLNGSPTALINAADQALYQAKANGRNSYVLIQIESE